MSLISVYAVMIAAVAAIAGHVFAAAAPTAPVPQATPGQYCGVYCVYGACRNLGVATTFPSLLKSRYIGSPKGSTFAELASALRERGLHATLVRRLSVATLVHCKWPVILYVRSDVELSTPNHFVLYLGDLGDKPIIMDPPSAPQLDSFRRIAAVWDGKGIIVSPDKLPLFGILRYTYGRFVAIALILLSIAVTAHGLRGVGRLQSLFSRRVGTVVGQALVIAMLAALAGVAQSVAGRGGLLAPAHESRELLRIYSAGDVPYIGFSQAKAMVAGGAVIVDARLPGDYEGGHIPGAINIPPGTATESRAQLLAGVRKGSPIMVYCESSGCPLAAMLANRLKIDGYGRVFVFTGGWRRWEAGIPSRGRGGAMPGNGGSP